MEKTGAQIIVEVLLEQGVDTVFGYPGGSVLNIYDALYEYRDRITHILTAHEQGASHAADGYARATGKTGVVFATSGPGATNLVTGIATAYMDSVPVVAITGNVGRDFLGRDSFQEVDITGITMPITKHNTIVKKIEDLAPALREAFRIANTGRKGPVLIDVPKDITAAVTDYEPCPPALPDPAPAVDPAQITAAAEALLKSRRPVLYAGGGVISANASEQLAALAHKFDIPVANSIMGLGSFPEDDPLSLGMIGMHGSLVANRAADECDVLIAVGARFSDRVAGNRRAFAAGAKIIHIDIDPAEMGKNVAIDLPVVGDAGAVLAALAQALPQGDHHAWRAELEAIRAEGEKHLTRGGLDGFIDPRDVVEAVDRLTPADTQIVTDVGQHQMWAAQYYTYRQPRTLITSGGLGTMGFGLGAAIGAQIANPDKRTVLFSGDGSFHMNLNEITTLASYHVPVVDIVMNNTVLGMVRQWQTAFYGKRYSQTDPHRKTDIKALAEAFGVKGMVLERPEEIEATLQEAFAYNGPVVIDCRIAPDQSVLPMIPPGCGVEDIMESMDF
ncbi:MAG: biosynthetic-type acetolactate synthase large subunit [Clostridia bacterium]